MSEDNVEIVRRHVTAFLLQRYHQVRLPKIKPEERKFLNEIFREDVEKLSKLLDRDLSGWMK